MMKIVDVYYLGWLSAVLLGGWFWLINRRLRRRLAHERMVRRRQLEYFALAVHELSSPLAAVRGRLDMLVVENLAELSGTQRQRFAPLVRVTERLNDLVSDLLDTSRLEAGRFSLSLHPMDIRPLLRECWQEAAPLLPSGSPHHLLLPRTPLVCSVDPVRFRQIIRNLLTNSVKYGAGSGVTLRARSRDGGCEIMIQDRGRGLTKAELAKLGQKFYRATIEPNQPPGTGLGLFITRRLVKAHRGSIKFDSPGLGSGLTALITLPTTKPPSQT